MYVNNHYAKVKYKGMEIVGNYSLHTNYTMKAHKRWCRPNSVQVQQSQKYDKISNVHTFSMYELFMQSLNIKE